jgi:hypothetical protein
MTMLEACACQYLFKGTREENLIVVNGYYFQKKEKVKEELPKQEKHLCSAEDTELAVGAPTTKDLCSVVAALDTVLFTCHEQITRKEEKTCS